MDMLALPVDVICGGILPYLSVCDLQALDTAFTNKYLRPQLRQVWKSYQYDAFDSVLKVYELCWLCGIGVRILSVTVDDDTEFDSIKNIPTLKRLNVISEIQCGNIMKIANNYRNVEELRFNCLYESNIDNAVSALAQNCRQMHTLHIDSKELTDTGIKALAQHSIHLDTLHLCESRVTDAGIQALCDNCPHLKHIGLIECDSLTDASLIAIANSYPLLRIIHLYIDRFTDDGLIYFADKCRELRSVTIWSDIITSRGLTALWAANPNLMDVDMSHNNFTSNRAIFQLAQCCPLLQKLNICCCWRITDAAVIAVAEHCPQLRSLNICDCYRLSDSSLIALGQHCHELKSINISEIENKSEVGIAALAAGCPLLQEFYAINTNITDADVVALARGCRDLRIIIVRGCKYIGIAAVSVIAENCPLISTLNLSHCTEVNDACLYIIAQHCRNLAVFDITGIKLFYVDAVISVIQSCRMLRELRCSFCFSDEKEKEFVKECARPRLKFFSS